MRFTDTYLRPIIFGKFQIIFSNYLLAYFEVKMTSGS